MDSVMMELGRKDTVSHKTVSFTFDILVLSHGVAFQ